MNKRHDVIVVGSGLAGLVSALSAAQHDAKVTLMTCGTGSLALSSGSIDVLGYIDGKRVDNPLDSLECLPKDHPYRIIGKGPLKYAITWLQAISEKYGMPLKIRQGDRNHNLITVMGTLKPSFMSLESFDISIIDEIKRAVVVTVENMKDVHPQLIIRQLQHYKGFEDIEFTDATISSHIGNGHRNITPLDIAHYVESEEGEAWLLEQLEPYAKMYPAILIPPILGIKKHQAIWKKLSEWLNVRIIEMVSIPPGVAGLRIREILKSALEDTRYFEIIENIQIKRAITQGGKCIALVSDDVNGERYWNAEQFIMATGGILGGGIETAPGCAVESIFKIKIDAPQDPQEWSSKEIFGKNFFSRMGIKFNYQLQPVDSNGNIILSNVRFCGRILGGYDFAEEKSGHGVALATGMHAGLMAAGEITNDKK